MTEARSVGSWSVWHLMNKKKFETKANPENFQKPFLSNFGAIVTFAILGTFIASVLTGLLVYFGGIMYLIYKLPLLECMMFGALISSTDPVTVLAIFQGVLTEDVHGNCSSASAKSCHGSLNYGKEMLCWELKLELWKAAIYPTASGCENDQCHTQLQDKNVRAPENDGGHMEIMVDFKSLVDLVSFQVVPVGLSCTCMFSNQELTCHMKELGTDVNHYALVFEESVLNDAVSPLNWSKCPFVLDESLVDNH
ncbi:hypothetical protein Cgig2_007152 [Carnegiea gigantea]|uniref:Cation/H+ exchanger transmembrane domain-containing protein n=1 Tax=Carnegiea gigantea TaxID=171969 RepID=A0A9Q1KJP9_9CARY|nr:hypothetical protein Cgig2_007152 [Carnegiea gigantea]